MLAFLLVLLRSAAKERSVYRSAAKEHSVFRAVEERCQQSNMRMGGKFLLPLANGSSNHIGLALRNSPLAPAGGRVRN